MSEQKKTSEGAAVEGTQLEGSHRGDVDPLSDVLQAVRLSGAVFFTIDGMAPWVAEAPPSRVLAPHVMPGAEHVIEYHVVKSGACWGGLIDEPAVRLETGDVLVFPQGDAHVVSSAPGMRGDPAGTTVMAREQTRVPLAVSLRGGSDERTEVICGFLGCDARPFNPLLSWLPRMLHVRATDRSDNTLHRLVELAAAECQAPRTGSNSFLAKVSELLFVEVVRRHVAALPPGTIGWFSALRDEHVGRALQRLHQDPAKAWTLEDLARQLGVSRSLLAERFTELVGIPPIQYLAQWRIQLAASLLRNTKASLAEIADRVGYGSEASLSRAFKRVVGIAPAPYRRGDAVALD